MRKILMSALALMALYSCKKDGASPGNKDNFTIEVNCPSICILSIDTATTHKSQAAVLVRNLTTTNYKKSYYARPDFGISLSIEPSRYDLALNLSNVKMTLDGKEITNLTKNGGWGFFRSPPE